VINFHQGGKKIRGIVQQEDGKRYSEHSESVIDQSYAKFIHKW